MSYNFTFDNGICYTESFLTIAVAFPAIFHLLSGIWDIWGIQFQGYLRIYLKGYGIFACLLPGIRGIGDPTPLYKPHHSLLQIDCREHVLEMFLSLANSIFAKRKSEDKGINLVWPKQLFFSIFPSYIYANR